MLKNAQKIPIFATLVLLRIKTENIKVRFF